MRNCYGMSAELGLGINKGLCIQRRINPIFNHDDPTSSSNSCASFSWSQEYPRRYIVSAHSGRNLWFNTHQLSRRRGFSKKTEFYFFFDVTDARKFRVDLNKFIPLIRTAEGVEKDRSAIDEHKRNKRSGLVPLVGVNIAFSHKGFAKVSWQLD